MRLIAFCTAVFAFSIGVVIAVLILFHTEEAMDRIPLKMLDIVVRTDVNAVEIPVRMDVTAVVIVVLMFVHTVEMFVRMDVSAVLMAVVVLLTLLWCILINGGKQYVVTNSRLIFKRGIINRTSHELLLRKCEGVQVDQSIPGRIFGYGTVIVTTGEVTNNYEYIRNPLRFSTEIHEQISHIKED